MLADAAQSGWVPYLLFESPGWLMVFFALSFAATRIIGRRTGNPRLLHLSWISIGAIAVLFAASYFVTTQREELAEAVEALVLAAEDQRMDDLEAMIDPEAMTLFQGDELPRDRVLERIASVEFDDIILLDSSALLDTQAGYGITGLRVNAKGSVNDFPGTNVSDWAIRWRYVDGRWVAIRLECLAFGADAIFNRNRE
jgi:hypothetical protein